MVKVCHCKEYSVKTQVVKLAPRDFQDRYGERRASYCASCDGMHHVLQEAIAVVRGPLNAHPLLHAQRKKNGQHILTWNINGRKVDTVEFFPWDRRFPMTETEPLIHLSWQLLMSKVAIIMDGDKTAGTWFEAKYQARGIAEVLAIQMKPFIETADDVVRHAVKKYKDPLYEVPGLGEHLWDPMMNPDGTPRTTVTASKGRTPVRAPAKSKPKVDNTSTRKLTTKEAEGIKEAVASGLFTEEDVASMFKVSLDTVKQAVSG